MCKEKIILGKRTGIPVDQIEKLANEISTQQPVESELVALERHNGGDK